MVCFYPMYYYQRRGKKGHCPAFTRVVPRVYPNYGAKTGHLKMNITNEMHSEIINSDNIESLVAVLSFPTSKYPLAHDSGKKTQRLSKVSLFYPAWL